MGHRNQKVTRNSAKGDGADCCLCGCESLQPVTTALSREPSRKYQKQGNQAAACALQQERTIELHGLHMTGVPTWGPEGTYKILPR